MRKGQYNDKNNFQNLFKMKITFTGGKKLYKVIDYK